MKLTSLILLLVITSCNEPAKQQLTGNVSTNAVPPHYTTIEEIPAPKGFTRTNASLNSFEYWLRKLRLKNDKTVYLYNGQEKPNQSAQFAVVDISRSTTDLQQCADVVMRMRAEHLFAEKKFDSIRFMDYNNKWYNWTGKDNRSKFDSYLQNVFGWCGSASLEKQLDRVQDFNKIKTGDVLIKGGFPGHAMLVADMAVNKKGEKVFLLLQGYQPAQDVHVVVNPSDQQLSPWYSITEKDEIITPEWKFYKNQLHTW